MKKIIKYRNLLGLLDQYDRMMEDISYEKTVKSKKQEDKKHIFIGEFALIDIRKNKASIGRTLPATKIDSGELLSNYEEILDLKHTFIIVDDHGNQASFICSVLNHFGYKTIFLIKGFHGFKHWYKRNNIIQEEANEED